MIVRMFVRRHRRAVLAAAVAAGSLAVATPRSLAAVHPGRQAGGPCPLGLAVSAHLAPAGGRPSTVCSGFLASFDGTPLSADLTLPVGRPGPRPLVVMLNGWGNHKTEFEATSLGGNSNSYTWHWNNAWFASQGYAVLNYTARGFWHSCGNVPAGGAAPEPVYLTEPGCAGPQSWTHLADRRYEVRDAQTLVGKLVDAGVANPDQVVVTGDSYGGGQSWLLAMSQDRVMRRDGTTVSWRSPRGVPIHLAAAVPLFGWTDLLQALIDNGRASIAQNPAAGSPPDGSRSSPVGVEKQSVVSGLYALGLQTGRYAPPGHPSSDVTGWLAAASAGEPYGADPVTAQAIHQLIRYRSAYYMPVPPPSAAVPTFAVQGVTDQIFSGLQAIQMEQRLRAADPAYPVWTVLADVGHPFADNPAPVWHHIFDQANTWLSDVLARRAPGQAKVEVATVDCGAGQATVWYAANRLRDIATTVSSFAASASGQTASGAGNPAENAATDPAAQSGCRTVPETETGGPGVATFTFAPVPQPGSTLIGAPVVTADALLAGSNAELAASLWQVDPAAGTETLITRAVQRLVGSPGTTLHLRFELWPTAWFVPPGDRLSLQLTQMDSPTWRADNEPSALTLTGVGLRVPTRAGGG